MANPEKAPSTDEFWLAALHEPSAELIHLNNLSGADAVALAHSLSVMAPEAIGEQHGEMVLAWAILDSPLGSQRQADLIDQLSDFGYSPILFQKAVAWEEESRDRSQLRNVLAMNGLMEAIYSGALDRIDLSTQLKTAKKPEFQLSNKQLDQYSLIPLRINDKVETATSGNEQDWSKVVTSDKGDIFYYVHLDAPVGFALTHRGLPQAFVSVSTRHHDELVIHQIQGVRGFYVDPDDHTKSIGDKPAGSLGVLEWRRLMIGLAEELADELGMSTIRIMGSGGQEDNFDSKTYGPREKQLKDGVTFTQARAEEVYDDTAEELGFLPDGHGNWFKPVGARLKEARGLLKLVHGRYY